MASASRERAGVASGIVPTARPLGQALGIALVPGCFTGAGETGAVTALWFGSAFAGVASAVRFLRMSKKE